jgi:hypothetical protein
MTTPATDADAGIPHHTSRSSAPVSVGSAAVRLCRAGIDDLILLEHADEVGGVWRDNGYPGAAVDVKSQLYSLSFAPNPALVRPLRPLT